MKMARPTEERKMALSDQFSPEDIIPIIDAALHEDLLDRGDITSEAVIPPDQTASVTMTARKTGRLSGAVLIRPVYDRLAERYADMCEPVSVELHTNDGDPLEPGLRIATVTGSVRTLLTGERTALNFMTHLSGIASLTAQFTAAAGNSGAAILDTRKTLPGYRSLQKYAVRCGGGTNHRMGLYDGMLIKDNHLAAAGGSVASAVSAARAYLTARQLSVPVEVEVDNLQQLRDALGEKPDIVLLDNMNPPQLTEAVRIRNELSPSTLLEASGGITLETVGCVAGTGVDRISIGALTHSAVALDIGCDWLLHRN